jgi:hypothetical protein
MKPRNMKKMSKVNDHEVLRSEREEKEGGGVHTFATTRSRPPKRKTQDTVGFSNWFI